MGWSPLDGNCNPDSDATQLGVGIAAKMLRQIGLCVLKHVVAEGFRRW